MNDSNVPNRGGKACEKVKFDAPITPSPRHFSDLGMEHGAAGTSARGLFSKMYGEGFAYGNALSFTSKARYIRIFKKSAGTQRAFQRGGQLSQQEVRMLNLGWRQNPAMVEWA